LKEDSDIEAGSFDILVIVPTQALSKYMMRRKEKEHAKEGNSLAKIIQK
jgi:hypothetical protein